MAPQLMATNGPVWRGLLSWTACAINSLPLDKDGGVRAGGLQDSRLEPQDGLALADDAGKTVIARLFGERFHVASAGPCETDDLADELERLFRLHQQLGALIVGEGHDLHDRFRFLSPPAP